jgi:hypothetical protein
MPPPTAPAESICIIMKPGNTSAMPVSAGVPRRDTHQVSINPVDAWTSRTSTFGQASRSKVATIGPSRSSRVRGLICMRDASSWLVLRPTAAAEEGRCVLGSSSRFMDARLRWRLANCK